MNWLPRKRALVPVDFSDKSFTAVDVARDLVEQAADIHVVHVLQELSAMEPSEVWRTIDEETRIRHATKALIDRLEEDGAGDVSASVFVGDPARRLATLASEENFDLIVLTS
ncbi:MAG: universal stress protein, partial [Pirellulaceae bacterium]|nr:universal stress protein [Pirellulaceae bacterium]